MNFIKKIKNNFKNRELTDQNYILKSEIKDELKSANRRGWNDRDKIAIDEIEKLHKDYKHEIYLMTIDHAEQVEEMSEIIRNLKEEKKLVEKKERDTDIRISNHSKIIDKFTRDFVKVRDLMNFYSGNFHKSENDIKELKR